MPYEVRTPVFEGPFDLLLHLILRDQVDLYEVSLCQIVDAYLREVERLRAADAENRLELGTATEFLLIAATLVELKARRLLPDDGDVDLDDELSLWEERDLLLARLLECKTFKDAALVLEQAMDEAARSVPRQVGPDERFAELQPDFLAGVTAAGVRAAFLRAVTPKPVPRVDIGHLPVVRVSVIEAVTEVADELRRARRLTFRELCSSLVAKLDVVVRFLAVLELYKQGHVEIEQFENFATLTVAWTGDDDTPTAELVSVDAYEG